MLRLIFSAIFCAHSDVQCVGVITWWYFVHHKTLSLSLYIMGRVLGDLLFCPSTRQQTFCQSCRECARGNIIIAVTMSWLLYYLFILKKIFENLFYCMFNILRYISSNCTCFLVNFFWCLEEQGCWTWTIIYSFFHSIFSVWVQHVATCSTTTLLCTHVYV